MQINNFLLNILAGQNVSQNGNFSSYFENSQKDPFFRLPIRVKEMFACQKAFSINKHYVKIKLMQNETNLWSTVR